MKRSLSPFPCYFFQFHYFMHRLTSSKEILRTDRNTSRHRTQPRILCINSHYSHRRTRVNCPHTPYLTARIHSTDFAHATPNTLTAPRISWYNLQRLESVSSNTVRVGSVHQDIFHEDKNTWSTYSSKIRYRFIPSSHQLSRVPQNLPVVPNKVASHTLAKNRGKRGRCS